MSYIIFAPASKNQYCASIEIMEQGVPRHASIEKSSPIFRVHVMDSFRSLLISNRTNNHMCITQQIIQSEAL